MESALRSDFERKRKEFEKMKKFADALNLSLWTSLQLVAEI